MNMAAMSEDGAMERLAELRLCRLEALEVGRNEEWFLNAPAKDLWRIVRNFDSLKAKQHDEVEKLQGFLETFENPDDDLDSENDVNHTENQSSNPKVTHEETEIKNKELDELEPIVQTQINLSSTEINSTSHELHKTVENSLRALSSTCSKRNTLRIEIEANAQSYKSLESRNEDGVSVAGSANDNHLDNDDDADGDDADGDDDDADSDDDDDDDDDDIDRTRYTIGRVSAVACGEPLHSIAADVSGIEKNKDHPNSHGQPNTHDYNTLSSFQTSNYGKPRLSNSEKETKEDIDTVTNFRKCSDEDTQLDDGELLLSGEFDLGEDIDEDLLSQASFTPSSESSFRSNKVMLPPLQIPGEESTKVSKNLNEEEYEEGDTPPPPLVMLTPFSQPKPLGKGKILEEDKDDLTLGEDDCSPISSPSLSDLLD